MVSSFRCTRRVEFADTDMAGIAHFSVFFRYMEECEHAFLRSLGLSVVTRDAEGEIGWPRVSAQCDYVRAARFEDVLDIELRVADVQEKSVTYEFVFSLEDNPVATGRMTAVCCRIVPGERPRSMPHPEAFRGQVQVYSASP